MGRAVVSNGPLIDFKVNGSGPGASIALPAGGGTVAVRATVRSIVPLARIVLVANGERIDEVSPPGDRQHFTYEADVDLSASTWIHLLVEGAPEERFPLDVAYAQAFTNPVWIAVDGQPHRSREGAEYGVRWIDRLEALARDWPDWRSDAEVAHVIAQFDEARHIYQQRGAEAPERMVPPTPGRRSVRPGGEMGACQ